MSKVHVIRHKVLVEKVSQRQVAEQFGVSRNTVAKYVEVCEPVRAPYTARSKPVADVVRPRLEALMQEWQSRTTAKQRITAPRLLRQLREEGFVVGMTTVSAYLREKRRLTSEVFVPLLYRPGEVAQVDFFEVEVEEGGLRRRVWKFLMRLMCSGYDYAWLYDRCDQVAFLDGHVRAFSYYGGVPARGVYDNLTPAVHFRLGLTGERERELSNRFAALASHYLFEPCFARPGQGHDKGGIEARGKGVRLQHLTPIPRGQTLSEIASALVADIEMVATQRRDRDGRSTRDRFENERESLRPLPAVPFEARRFVSVSVSSKATVQIEGALYSVPEAWARLDASAYVGVDDVRIVCRGTVLTYAKARPGQRQIRYRDYLSELSRKPQAVRQVAPELLAELGEPWGRLWALLVSTHGEREAARVLSRILGAVVTTGEAQVVSALTSALAGERPDLLALGVLLHSEQAGARVRVPEALAGYEIDSARAADYDYLIEGGVQ